MIRSSGKRPRKLRLLYPREKVSETQPRSGNGQFDLNVRILLLNEYFPPDTSATAKIAATIVEALISRHEVIVISGRPSYEPTETFPWRLLRRESRGNLTVERVGSTAYPRMQMKRRIANYLSYSVLAFFRALFVRTDVVLAMTDPPFCGILGAVVAMLKRRPFVYNIRDMYPDMAVGGEIVRQRVWVRWWEAMHRWAMRRAARVIVLGEDMRDRIVAKGIDASRVFVVRDGVAVPADLPPENNPVALELRAGAKFVALHAGNLGFYGAWNTLLEAAKRLGNDGCCILFVGEGAQKQKLISAAGNSGAARFLPFRPASEIPFVLSSADVHIVTVKRGLEGVIVPSKLYPILAAGKPVLALSTSGTDAARIVAREKCGVVVDPDDPEALAAAIQALAADRDAVVEMGRRARACAAEYDNVLQLRKFIAVMEGVLKNA